MAERMSGPVLLIGTGGMLARAWAERLRGAGLGVEEPTLAELDLTQPATLARWIAGGKYPLVLNCAAWTDVDGAEQHAALATAINGTGVGELARVCAAAGSKLVHFSTDYVFNGRGTAPYPPEHPRDPLSAYGRSKALGEELLEQSRGAWLLIRTSWLYAPWGRNFVRTMARLTRQRPSLRVVDDQRGRPTSAERLAEAGLALLDKGATGIWHVTDGGECSWFELAREIGQRMNPACRIEPCTTEQYPLPAKRPAYSVLDISRTERLIGPRPGWRDNLAGVLARLEPDAPAAPPVLGGKRERTT